MMHSIMVAVISFLAILGSIVVLISAIGVLRLPGLYLRMHAMSKAGSFGLALLLGACALKLGTLGSALICLLVLFLLFFTTALAGHLVARSAYRSGEVESMGIDELALDLEELDAQSKPGHPTDRHKIPPGVLMSAPVGVPGSEHLPKSPKA